MPKHSTTDIIAAFHAEGIDCQPHQLGLAAHCQDPVAYAKALKQCQPTVLRVLTMNGDQGIPQQPACTQDPMLCDCPVHEAERVVSIKRGPRDRDQPWQPRARRAA